MAMVWGRFRRGWVDFAEGWLLFWLAERYLPFNLRVRLDWTRSNAKRRLANFASGRLRHSRRLPTFARGC